MTAFFFNYFYVYSIFAYIIMVMKYFCTLFIFLFFSSGFIFSQDVHFSMMKFSPLTVNPSLAGLQGKYNTNVNFRSQWNSVADPFTTMGASFDTHFFGNHDKGFLAAGVNFFYDIAGNMKMTTSNANLSLAYHIRMNNTNTIGLGLQGGYASRGLRSGNGMFASQYDGTGFNTAISSGESFIGTNNNFFDTGAGIVYSHDSYDETSFSSRGFKLLIGFSTYHLTKPNYSYLQGGKDDLNMRFVGFVESEFMLGKSNWGLMPAVYYQRQGNFQEIYVGTYIKYNIVNSTRITSFRDRLYIAYGPFYRFGDAFVNKLLIDYKGFALGFAYDINLSSLTTASKGRGGFEIMFRYVLTESAERPRIN